jgi:hypothetical protein
VHLTPRSSWVYRINGFTQLSAQNDPNVRLVHNTVNNFLPNTGEQTRNRTEATGTKNQQ